MRPVLSRPNTSNANTPAEHVDAERLSKRPALKEEVGRELSTHVGYVEDRGEPLVLLSDEVCVIS